MNWITACWYQSHFQGNASIVFVTDNEVYAQNCASKTIPCYKSDGITVCFKSSSFF